MAIFVHATLPGVTTDQYDALNAELQKTPEIFAGCLSHTCVPGDSGLEIYDLWESEEAMNKFTAAMMPVAERSGMPAGPGGGPTISQVHNYWVPSA